MSSNKILITLQSNDNLHFTIEKDAAINSMTIKNMLNEDCLSDVISLPNLDSKTLALVVEFLKKQAENHDLNVFVEEQQVWTLMDLANAATYLGIKEMQDIVCKKLADMLKGKTPEEIRLFFNIANDFTPEEEEEIRAENAWAFE